MTQLLKLNKNKRIVIKFLFFPKNLMGEWHWFTYQKIVQDIGTRPMQGGEENYIRPIWLDSQFYYNDTNLNLTK